jgi:hypothetical protein
MKNNVENLLKKGRLAKAYNELPNIQYKEAVKQEYKNLLKSLSCKNKMLYKHLVNSILPAVAIYRILEKNGFNKDKTINIIRESVFYADRIMKEFFQKIGKMPFFFSLFRIMCKNSLKYVFGKPGWDMRWLTDNSYEIKWNCHSCFYNDEFRKYGVQDLLIIFCASDDFVYGNIPNIKWERKNTIGFGSEICDFRFYNTNKTMEK